MQLWAKQLKWWIRGINITKSQEPEHIKINIKAEARSTKLKWQKW
jgi:hypothetical protein